MRAQGDSAKQRAEWQLRAQESPLARKVVVLQKRSTTENMAGSRQNHACS